MRQSLDVVLSVYSKPLSHEFYSTYALVIDLMERYGRKRLRHVGRYEDNSYTRIGYCQPWSE
jgi:hypothetical protein